MQMSLCYHSNTEMCDDFCTNLQTNFSLKLDIDNNYIRTKTNQIFENVNVAKILSIIYYA